MNENEKEILLHLEQKDRAAPRGPIPIRLKQRGEARDLVNGPQRLVEREIGPAAAWSEEDWSGNALEQNQRRPGLRRREPRPDLTRG